MVMDSVHLSTRAIVVLRFYLCNVDFTLMFPGVFIFIFSTKLYPTPITRRVSTLV